MREINYQYYEWLILQVEIPNDKTYFELFERMHNFEFAWTVPNDNNRKQDAIDLRREFAKERVSEIVLGTATLLEVLIALSRRTTFTVGDRNAPRWAWILLKNLGLHKAFDPFRGGRGQKVDEILYNLVWRLYEPNGKGGFFPLKHPKEDQTKVEIWYQMQAYVIEMEGL